MSTDNTIQDASRKPKVHTLLSVLTIVIGLVLMILKVYTDSEPGAIPLLLIVFGIGWYFVMRVRIQSHDNTAYRFAVGVALAAALILVWLSLGVGVIGKDGDPANLMYFGVLAVVIALIAGLGYPWSGPLEILDLNGFFVALFVGSAWLFRYAARGRPEQGAV